MHRLMFCVNVLCNAHLFDTTFIVAVFAVVAMIFFVNPNFTDMILTAHHANLWGSLPSLQSWL